MRVLNQMDRFDLVPDADKYTAIADEMDAMVKKHNQYIREEGFDLPEAESWVWKPLK